MRPGHEACWHGHETESEIEKEDLWLWALGLVLCVLYVELSVLCFVPSVELTLEVSPNHQVQS
jgi:hypothetical protein